MRAVVHLGSQELEPDPQAVLFAQGVPRGVLPSAAVRHLVETALLAYRELARPVAVYQELQSEELAAIYRGEGNNAWQTPLQEIYPRARYLALFASTLGEELCYRIRVLFEGGDPALGSMLDAVASLAADRSAKLLGQSYLESLQAKGEAGSELRVLPYSPGYCGWHVSGQRALFAALQPEELGIHLNESCLMTPLKSVSGVLLVAEVESHDFVNEFEFCAGCATHDCRDRIASITTSTGPGSGREEKLS